MTANATSAIAADQRHAHGELRRERRAPVVVEVHQISRPRRPSGPVARGGLAAAAELDRVDRQRGPQHAADAHEHGDREQGVEHHGHDHVADHERAHPRADVEHERHGGEGEHPAGGGGGAHRHRHEAVARVAHLAEAADRVAHGREHQRGDAHRRAGDQVEQEARREAGGAAGDAARVVGDRGHREHHEVGVAAEHGRSGSTADTWRITASSSRPPTRTNASGERITGWPPPAARRPGRWPAGG